MSELVGLILALFFLDISHREYGSYSKKHKDNTKTNEAVDMDSRYAQYHFHSYEEKDRDNGIADMLEFFADCFQYKIERT